VSRIHFPASRAELLPLPTGKGLLGEIFEAAILHHMRKGADGPAIRRYVARAVVLVLKVHGRAEYADETGRTSPLVPGSCFLVDPRVGHRYGPVEGSYWTEMYLSFRGPLFDSFDLSANLTNDPIRHLSPLKAWQRKLREVLPHGGHDEPDACNGRLIAFLAEAFLRQQPSSDGAAAWVALAKRMLERELLTVTEITDRLSATTGLAPETLRKQFRRVTGSSMKSWQLAGRVANAHTLLARGTMTQKEIAAALGFSNPQHFSRCIRKSTGKTPGRLAKDR